MYEARQTIWRLVQTTAEELSKVGQTPFTRGDLIKGVQRANPNYGQDSINPIIQGLTDNLRGGAPGAVGKNILHSVGRGLFVLHPRLGKDSTTVVSAANNLKTTDEYFSFGIASISLEGFRFTKVCDIQVETDAEGQIRGFLPQDRYDNWRKLELNRYGKGPFCKFKIPTGLNSCGVYVLLVNGEPAYVGECERLADRFNMGYGNVSPRNCYKGGQETNCRINSLILSKAAAGSTISLYFFPTEQYKQVELSLRRSMNLRWNRV